MAAEQASADALVLIDVLADFAHEDGAALLRSFRDALPGLTREVTAARARRIPVVYANDDFGTWSGDRATVESEARSRCPDAHLLDPVAPTPADAFICKPRYSAFDHTPLDILLRERKVRRLLLAGTATEMCVAQTAIDARECGYQVSVLVDACASVGAANAEVALRYLERVVGVRLVSGGVIR
jgi:nicotinamidase-related amidase